MFIIDTTDDRQGSISAQGENGDECKETLFDNSSDSKWLDLSPQGSRIQYSYAPGICGHKDNEERTMRAAGAALKAWWEGLRRLG